MDCRSSVNSCIIATVTLALSHNMFLILGVDVVEVVAVGVDVELKATHFLLLSIGLATLPFPKGFLT